MPSAVFGGMPTGPSPVYGGSTEAPDEDDEPHAFVRHFFEQKAGHPLIAWCQAFRCENNKKMTLLEFIQGMVKLGYEGEASDLFMKLDNDDSGFLTISEVSPSSSDLWASFIHWAGKTFFSEEDMIEKLSGRKYAEAKRKPSKLIEDQGMTRRQFYSHASSLGWYGGFEQILFMAMDVDNEHVVHAASLGWFEEERNRQIKKAKYKTRGKEGGMACMRKRLHALRSLQAFTQWLRYHYGPRLFHPWRRGIDKDGSMSVTRVELSTFCKNAGWRGDTNALWHALDNDDSGVTSLEEFSGTEARQLALFKKWMDGTFGSSRKAYSAFAAKCRKKGSNAKSFDKDDFVFSLRSLGYEHDAHELFEILDWDVDGDGITYKELRILDNWAPESWLSATPEPEAAEAFKSHLFKKWKQPLKAWRALDEECSGKVNFKEFSVVAARVGFKGNLQGAWMALDEDASGYIALAELAPHAAEALGDFRRWANLFFGSVMEAFRALDADGGGTLTRAEFKKSVTKYGFRGDREELFTLLDAGADGSICVEEICFLDEWEISEVNDVPIPSFHEVNDMLRNFACDSESSDEELDDELVEGQFKEMRNTLLRAPRRIVVLQEEELPLNDVHKPLPGTVLMEILGETSPRPRAASYAIPGKSQAAGFTSAPDSCGNASPQSRIASHLCSYGAQRPRNHRLRKAAPRPYLGGAPLMSKQAGGRPGRMVVARPPASHNYPLPALPF